MVDVFRAQTSDMELLTLFPEKTTADTVADLRVLSYDLPNEDVAEILGVIATGVKIT